MFSKYMFGRIGHILAISSLILMVRKTKIVHSVNTIELATGGAGVAGDADGADGEGVAGGLGVAWDACGAGVAGGAALPQAPLGWYCQT